MRLFKILILLTFCGFSFYGPYVAFLNDSPRLKTDVIDIYPGDSINASINKISSDNLINKIFIKLYLMSNDIDDFKAGEYGIQNKKIKDIMDTQADQSKLNSVLEKQDLLLELLYNVDSKYLDYIDEDIL